MVLVQDKTEAFDFWPKTVLRSYIQVYCMCFEATVRLASSVY